MGGRFITEQVKNLNIFIFGTEACVEMRCYKFYDTNLNGDADYDIAGKEYIELIDFCCQNACVLSFSYPNESKKLFKQIENFKIRTEESYSLQGYNNSYYKICLEVSDFLKNNSPSFFEWVCWKNGEFRASAEDLVFFRADGTILLSSDTHNGKITLRPRDEDVSKIVSNPLWIEEKNKQESYGVKRKVFANANKVSSQKEAIDYAEQYLNYEISVNEIKNYKLFEIETNDDEQLYWLQYHCYSSKYGIVIIDIKLNDDCLETFWEQI